MERKEEKVLQTFMGFGLELTYRITLEGEEVREGGGEVDSTLQTAPPSSTTKVKRIPGPFSTSPRRENFLGDADLSLTPRL